MLIKYTQSATPLLMNELAFLYICRHKATSSCLSGS